MSKSVDRAKNKLIISWFPCGDIYSMYGPTGEDAQSPVPAGVTKFCRGAVSASRVHRTWHLVDGQPLARTSSATKRLEEERAV
jgi:hypothetical protein